MSEIKEFYEGLKTGQKKFGENIAIIINSILLSIVYFIGVGLSALFGIFSNKQFLDLDLDTTKDTYWQDLNLKKKQIGDYYRQF